VAKRPLYCVVTKSGRLAEEALSDKVATRPVKQALGAARLDPVLFFRPSLRAGLETAAGDAGAGLADFIRQTRHTSTEVALAYPFPRIPGKAMLPRCCSRPTRTTKV